MKVSILLSAALLFCACQNDPNSELEQKRQALEQKRKELQEKKEISELNKELKSVESEIKAVDGSTGRQVSNSNEPQGLIRGQGVSLRTSNSSQSEKRAVLNNGEQVSILRKQASGNTNEAILLEAVTIQENGQSYQLNKGKSLIIQQEDEANGKNYVSFSSDKNQTVYTWLKRTIMERTTEKDWFEIRRKDGTQGWVLGDFLTIK